MDYVNVAVKEKVWRRLIQFSLKGETFSEAINRALDGYESVSEELRETWRQRALETIWYKSKRELAERERNG